MPNGIVFKIYCKRHSTLRRALLQGPMSPKRIQMDVSECYEFAHMSIKLICHYPAFAVDLSLYKNESQIEKKTPTKRKAPEPKSTKKTPSTAAALATSSGKQKKLQEDNESGDDVNYGPSNKRKKTPIKNSAKKKAPPPKSAAKVRKLFI